MPQFVFDQGEIRVEDTTSRAIGEYTDTEITLDLGWCRLAGVDVRLLDDARRPGKPDRHRGGIAFERKARG